MTVATPTTAVEPYAVAGLAALAVAGTFALVVVNPDGQTSTPVNIAVG